MTEEVTLTHVLQAVMELKDDIKQVEIKLDKRIDRFKAVLSKKIDDDIKQVEIKLDKRIDRFEAMLSQKIDSVETRLSEKMDNVEAKLNKRIDNLEMKLGNKMDKADAKITVLSEGILDTQADVRILKKANQI